MAAEERADPDSFKVEYRSNFAEVIDAFLNPDMVDRIFSPEFNQKILGRDLSPQYGSVAYFTYAGHGDPATVKANFGLAVGHKEEVEGENGMEQHVVFDFIDAFYPEDFENNTIDWLIVMPTLTELITNFRPKEFTFDQYESAQTIQLLQDNLRQANLTETNVYSIFASQRVNETRAKNFRTAINLGRVHAPHPTTFNPGARINSIELAKNELKFLQEKNGRVEKQSVGPIQTKDIADCMMTVVNTLIGDSISNMYGNLNMDPAFGLPGGYPVGNTNNFPELQNIYQGMRRPGAGHSLMRGHRKQRRH